MNKVYRKCPLCAEQHYMELSNEQCRKLYEYEHKGGYIQELFSELDKFEREFIKTGYCSEHQEDIFGAKKEKEYSF